MMRGMEKADIEKTVASAAADRETENAVLSRSPESWHNTEYQTVTLNGRWLSGHGFLLDNRLFNGRAGYEVLSPFELSGDRSVILVNRGWLAKPVTPGQTSITPAPPVNNKGVRGEIYRPQKGFTLGKTYQQPVRWPLPVLYYDFDDLSAALDRTLQPVVLVLAADSGHSFRRIWQPANMPASRHYGYAVQWWGLTLTLLIFGIIWRRHASRHTPQQP